MKLALTLMRRLAKGTEEGLTMRAVEERVAKCAAAEKAQDAAARAQKAIDDDAATERAAVRAAAETRAERDDRAATDARAGGKTTASAGNKSPKKLPETSVGSGTRPSTRAAALLAAGDRRGNRGLSIR